MVFYLTVFEFGSLAAPGRDSPRNALRVTPSGAIYYRMNRRHAF
jgi:hypothetical protein